MTTLVDRLKRCQRLVGCIERTTDHPQVLVAARVLAGKLHGDRIAAQYSCFKPAWRYGSMLVESSLKTQHKGGWIDVFQ